MSNLQEFEDLLRRPRRVITGDIHDSSLGDISQSDPLLVSLGSNVVCTASRDPPVFYGPRVGTGRVIPSRFFPRNPRDTPQTLFPEGKSPSGSPQTTRFIHRQRPDTFLVYTDGSCLNNGIANPRAGCAFVFRDVDKTDFYRIRFRVEIEGPTGEKHVQSSDRAELRAIIAALRFRHWVGEGFKTMVIATDSESIVEGITNRIVGWIQRGWKNPAWKPVKNRDLWECLLGEMERWNDQGMKVQFWRIPREWNTEADRHARIAATERTRIEFCDRSGVLVA